MTVEEMQRELAALAKLGAARTGNDNRRARTLLRLIAEATGQSEAAVRDKVTR